MSPAVPWRETSSTEFIQEEDSTQQHAQGDPEMNVGSDRTIEIEGRGIAGFYQYRGLLEFGIRSAILGTHRARVNRVVGEGKERVRGKM